MITAIQVGEELLNTSGVRAITETEAAGLATIRMLEKHMNAHPASDDKLPRMLVLLREQARRHGVQAEEAAMAAAAMLCDRPAMMMMYCATLHALSRQLGRKVSMRDFVMHLGRGNGFPTTAEMHRVWLMQKDGGHNWLDEKEAWR